MPAGERWARPPAAEPPHPRQRVLASLVFEVAAETGATRPVRHAETGGLRLRLPRSAAEGALEAVILNTGGGIACGDRLCLDLRAGRGTDLTLSTPAAERIYRSDGAVAEIQTTITVADEAGLAWLPQETILFDAARLARRFTVDLAATARFLAFEAVVFGRAARGERLASGLFRDAWRIRRAGRLVYADTLRLEGGIAAALARPAIGAGAGAIGTLLYVAPDAEGRLDEARALLPEPDASCDCGASAWNGLLAIRLLARDNAALRRAAVPLLERFRGRPLPRVWHS